MPEIIEVEAAGPTPVPAAPPKTPTPAPELVEAEPVEDAEDAPLFADDVEALPVDLPEDGSSPTFTPVGTDGVELADIDAGALIPFDPLQRYLAEIRQMPTLSREEEHELAVTYFSKGDMHAAYRLVMANLRLVVMIAREYQRNASNVLDLVQEGNIGLLEAVKQYDPFRGIRFPSYAVYWIRAYMLRYLINNIRLVKIGTTQAQRKLFFNLQKEKEKLEAEGFVPEARLLADRLKVKESEVLEMEQRLALPDLSVDAPVSGEDENLDMHGILSDASADTEEMVGRQELAEKVRAWVDEFKQTADDKERAIIDERLFTDDPKTLQEIADHFNLSRERIRQIETRVKDALKDFLAARMGDNPEENIEQ